MECVECVPAYHSQVKIVVECGSGKVCHGMCACLPFTGKDCCGMWVCLLFTGKDCHRMCACLPFRGIVSWNVCLLTIHR